MQERKSNMIIMMMQFNRYYDILLLYIYQSVKYLCRNLYNEPQSGDDKQYIGYFRATRLLKSILIMLMRVDLALKRV